MITPVGLCLKVSVFLYTACKYGTYLVREKNLLTQDLGHRTTTVGEQQHEKLRSFSRKMRGWWSYRKLFTQATVPTSVPANGECG